MNFNETIEKMRDQCLQGDPVNEWELDDLRRIYEELQIILRETENSLRSANLRIMEIEKENTINLEHIEYLNKKIEKLEQTIECYKTTIVDLESKLDDDNDYDKNIEIDQTDLD